MTSQVTSSVVAEDWWTEAHMNRISKLLSVVLGVMLALGTSLQWGTLSAGQASVPEAVAQVRAFAHAVPTTLVDRRARSSGGAHLLILVLALPRATVAVSPSIQWLPVRHRLATLDYIRVASPCTRSPPVSSTLS